MHTSYKVIIIHRCMERTLQRPKPQKAAYEIPDSNRPRKSRTIR